MIATAPRDKEANIGLIRGGRKMSLSPLITDREQYASAHKSELNEGNDAILWLGMELTTYTQEIARNNNMEYFEGVFVRRVGRGSPSDKSEIMPGSVITQVDNREVRNLDELQAVARELQGRATAIPVLLVDPRGSIEYRAIRP